MSSIDFSLLGEQDKFSDRFTNYIKYINLLTEHLNFIHKEQKSQRYWEILIGPWLMHFIWLIDYLDQTEIGISQEFDNKNFLIPYDYKTFVSLLNHPTEYSQLMIKIMKERNSIINKQKKFIKFRLFKTKLIKNFFFRIFNLFFSPFLNFAEIIMVSPNISFFSQIKIFFITKFKILPLLINIDEEKTFFKVTDRIDWVKKRTSFDNLLDKTLYEIILLQIPYIYIEGLSEIKKEIPKIKNIRKLKSIFSAYGWQENDNFKLIAAEAAEKNISLIGIQHGGSPYGTGIDPTTLQETELVDYFITWGWKERDHHIPFGSINNTTFRDRVLINRKNKQRNSFIFISTTGSDYWPNGIGSPSGVEWEKYYNTQRYFLKKIDKKLINKLIFRLHPFHFTSSYFQKKNIELDFPDLVFDKNHLLENTLSNAKCVILDNIQTVFYQILVCNIPIIVILDMKIWKFKSKFIITLKQMEELGILHTSVNSAVSFLNLNQDQIDKWWSQKEIQDLVQDLCNKYSRVVEDPELKLSNLLMNIDKR